MISSKFSRMIAPLAIATTVAGGFAVNGAIKENATEEKEKIEIVTETPKETNPLQDPKTMGTLFALGLAGTTAAATLGKAVDVRYKNGFSDIEEIYSYATSTPEDWKEACNEYKKELNKQGVKYDKKQIEQFFKPKSKQEILEVISEKQKNLNRVTGACAQNKEASKQLNYLVEEVKSAVLHDQTDSLSNDKKIAIKMLYEYTKATTPKKKWNAIDKAYRQKYPNINFDKKNGTKLESNIEFYTRQAVLKESFKYINVEELETDELISNLALMLDNLVNKPEMLNKYDREACGNLINNALELILNNKPIPNELYKKILMIYAGKSQAH